MHRQPRKCRLTLEVRQRKTRVSARPPVPIGGCLTRILSLGQVRRPRSAATLAQRATNGNGSAGAKIESPIASSPRGHVADSSSHEFPIKNTEPGPETPRRTGRHTRCRRKRAAPRHPGEAGRGPAEAGKAPETAPLAEGTPPFRDWGHKAPGAWHVAHLEALGLGPHVAVVSCDGRPGDAPRSEQLLVHVVLPAHGV